MKSLVLASPQAGSRTGAADIDQTLLVDFTQAAARKACERYRTALGLVLALEAAAALALALLPRHLAQASGAHAGWPWLRPLGVAILVMTLLFSTGRRDPSRAKLVNLLGIFGRPLLALVLGLAGGALVWAGAAELVAAIALAQLYFRYFEAEVTSRP